MNRIQEMIQEKDSFPNGKSIDDGTVILRSEVSNGKQIIVQFGSKVRSLDESISIWKDHYSPQLLDRKFIEL